MKLEWSKLPVLHILAIVNKSNSCHSLWGGRWWCHIFCHDNGPKWDAMPPSAFLSISTVSRSLPRLLEARLRMSIAWWQMLTVFVLVAIKAIRYCRLGRAPVFVLQLATCSGKPQHKGESLFTSGVWGDAQRGCVSGTTLRSNIVVFSLFLANTALWEDGIFSYMLLVSTGACIVVKKIVMCETKFWSRSRPNRTWGQCWNGGVWEWSWFPFVYMASFLDPRPAAVGDLVRGFGPTKTVIDEKYHPPVFEFYST